MTAHGQLPASFVEAWIPEFVKSVEMFAGTIVAVESRGDEVPAVPEAVIWHEQAFQHQETGRCWIGTPVAGSVALLGEAAENETAGVALFRQLLAQSLKVAAEMLSTSSHPGLKCLDESGTEAPPSEATLHVLWITGGPEPVPVWLHCDSAFAALFATAAAVPPKAGTAAMAPPALASAPDSLHGIDLPVVVVLGRASLRIAEVLKMTVGSIVELDTRVGEPVDVCIQGIVVARGEVVSIRGNYGVRIVEVLRRNRLQLPGGSLAPALAAAGR